MGILTRVSLIFRAKVMVGLVRPEDPRDESARQALERRQLAVSQLAELCRHLEQVSAEEQKLRQAEAVRGE
jgi:hypothetical protein